MRGPLPGATYSSPRVPTAPVRRSSAAGGAPAHGGKRQRSFKGNTRPAQGGTDQSPQLPLSYCPPSPPRGCTESRNRPPTPQLLGLSRPPRKTLLFVRTETQGMPLKGKEQEHRDDPEDKQDWGTLPVPARLPPAPEAQLHPGTFS